MLNEARGNNGREPLAIFAISILSIHMHEAIFNADFRKSFWT
jgi:hypothetical protein